MCRMHPLSPPVSSSSASLMQRLWWPRRPLATLDRKPRQGRKAATVSVDAGAEASRRGHRHSWASPMNPKVRFANLGPQARTSDPCGFAAPPCQGGFAPAGESAKAKHSSSLSSRAQRGICFFRTADAFHGGAATLFGPPGPAIHGQAFVAARGSAAQTRPLTPARAGRQQRYRSMRVPRPAGGAIAIHGLRT